MHEKIAMLLRKMLVPEITSYTYLTIVTKIIVYSVGEMEIIIISITA